MNIEKFIDKNMCVENKKIVFEEHEYEYIDIICQYNNTQYSHLLMLDLVEDLNLQKIVSEMTYEKYKQYEKILLEDIFFSSTGDTRFNIYLILVIPRGIKINGKSDIQKDFQYARKMFLYENEVDNYFMDGISLKRYAANNNLPDPDEKHRVKQELCESKRVAESCLSLEVKRFLELKKNQLKIKDLNFFKEIFACMENVEQYFADEEKRDIRGKGLKNRKNRKSEVVELKCIKSISQLYLSNYRCYKECTIPFRRVNLLYGENGVGKTTILEGIECGITGLNMNVPNSSEVLCRVQCIDENNKLILLSNQNSNIGISSLWYNISSQNNKEFNDLFHQFNYFNTNWVSEFAIEGKSKVNVSQLQKYLGIEKIEKEKQELLKLYGKIIELAECNIKLYKKSNYISISPFNMGTPSYSLFKRKQKEMIKAANDTIRICKDKIELLCSEKDALSLHIILDKHIEKIESIFKLLIAENEFSSLEIQEGEICARIGNAPKRVLMSQMSTGQKICLALSLMFSLFLSLEKAPNIVMLDEPVANLDDIHMLNLLDVLRRMAIAGTQIFFTTANPDIAKMFRRKFSFLKDEFAFFRIKEDEHNVQIDCEHYSPNEEDVKWRRKISIENK